MKRHLALLLAVLIFGSVMGIVSVNFAAEGKWTVKTDMPTARFGLSAAAVDGKIYAIGGWNQTGKLSTVEEYDPTTDTWVRKTDIPTARKSIGASVVNGRIYTFGGQTVVNAGGGQGILAAVEEYDPATDTWTKKTDIPTPRSGPVAVAVNGKIYVIAGYRGFDTPVVELYDPVTDTWQKRANVPMALTAAGFASVDGKIYLFGGATNRVLESTYEYDPVADVWTQKANMPAPRMLLSASAIDGKIYLIGGDTNAGGGPTASVLVYDPATDTWADGIEMQTARGSHATAVVDGKIYAIGGHTGVPWGNMGAVYPTVEEYTPGAPQGEGPQVDGPATVSPRGKLATTWGTIKLH